MQLHTSGEDYLEAILILEKTTGKVRSIDLAEHLGVTKPSVSRAVSLLKQGGFLVSESSFLELTEKGRDTAKKVYEKHCFFKEKLMEAEWTKKPQKRRPAFWNMPSVRTVSANLRLILYGKMKTKHVDDLRII